MPLTFEQFIETHTLTPEEVSARTSGIYEATLSQSQHLDAGNFTRVHPTDLRNLFDLYDQRFFNAGIRNLLGSSPISFRFSRRMTQAGGKASRRIFRDRGGKISRTEYEIAISTALLFETFQEDERPIVVSGLQCSDRLEAMQRIIEHEITHLIEGLLWDLSSCAAPRFQSIAGRFFGHTDHRHHLITPREKALRKFGIKPGDQV
ncbi:MAG: SprT-like family protein, partial [Planctomycetes bacterium]|nr:SprT-like family protein [Planctomycetota bacterium]